MSVASQLAVDARAALVDEVDGAAEAQSSAVPMPSAGSGAAVMGCWCAVAETGRSVLTAGCVESVGRRAELEPKLTPDVGASWPVSEPTMPAVSAGCVVSGEGGADAEAELVVASTAVGTLVVLDAAGAAKLPAEVADQRAVSPSSIATLELVRAQSRAGASPLVADDTVSIPPGSPTPVHTAVAPSRARQG